MERDKKILKNLIFAFVPPAQMIARGAEDKREYRISNKEHRMTK